MSELGENVYIREGLIYTKSDQLFRLPENILPGFCWAQVVPDVPWSLLVSIVSI
mgnify:CR=1 FL=1